MCFIKFLDSKGLLVALSTLDGYITYITQAGKDVFQHRNSSEIVGQNVSVVLKDPQQLEVFKHGSSPRGSQALCEQTIEVETVQNIFITALFSPSSSPQPHDATSPDRMASQPSPTHSPSSLAQAFQSQPALFHEINKDTTTADDEGEELSFDECFNDAAVECR
mmetsp:Transcript_9532/g.15866  ORF Transcript_9532/g.15866 Transcript_9532/m.15866 type:complete len:164 (-) Transcript_9532:448-939(-)